MPHGFSSRKRDRSIFELAVYLFYLLCWLAALPDLYRFVLVVFYGCCYAFFGVHDADNFAPIIMNSLLFQLIANGGYQPVGQQSQMKVCHRRIVGFVEDLAQIKVCFSTLKVDSISLIAL